MNPFRDISLWLISHMPPEPPDWAVGAAVFAGILGPIMALVIAGAIVATIIERRET